MTTTLQERLAGALRQIPHPRLGADILSVEAVRDIGTTLDGKVHLTVLLSAADDATLVRDIRDAITAVQGVTDVRIDVKDPAQAGRPGAPVAMASGQRAASPAGSSTPSSSTPSSSTPSSSTPSSSTPSSSTPSSSPSSSPAPSAANGGKSRALPVMDATPQSGTRNVAPPPPVSYPNLGRVLAVSSGKGGVGKSSVAVNLAIALALRGARVGIMDADVYGPNLPLMLGVDQAPAVRDERIIPLEAHGIKVMSIGFLIEKEQPAIWRGPIVMKIITQFLRDVQWGQLDYFLVDMPPGTGDAQLSLVQATPVHGALIVTTPQQVAVGDALRGVKMFERVSVPVLGIVENMSWFESPETGKPLALFGSGGGQRLADEVQLPLLAQVPLDPRIQEGGDTGRPIIVAEPAAKASKVFRELADAVVARLDARWPG